MSEIVRATSSFAPGWFLGMVAFLCIVKLAESVLRDVMLQRRQRQALELAPRVYRAGGNAADVLRALADRRPTASVRDDDEDS